jgi:hypothetical protein
VHLACCSCGELTNIRSHIGVSDLLVSRTQVILNAVTSSINHSSKNMREPNSPTYRQFRHQVVTNAEYRAYAAARCDISHQDNCASRELHEASSSLVGAAIRRLICVRSAVGADSPPLLRATAFRHRAITSHPDDPSARRPHEYHQQAKQIPLTGVRRFPAARFGGVASLCVEILARFAGRATSTKR